MRKKTMLRDYRKAQGWTLEQASSKFKISLSYLSEIETGKREMTLHVARKIEAATRRLEPKLRAIDLLGMRESA